MTKSNGFSDLLNVKSLQKVFIVNFYVSNYFLMSQCYIVIKGFSCILYLVYLVKSAYFLWQLPVICHCVGLLHKNYICIIRSFFLHCVNFCQFFVQLYLKVLVKCGQGVGDKKEVNLIRVWSKCVKFVSYYFLCENYNSSGHGKVNCKQ